MTEFDLACERLPEAEDAQSERGSDAGSAERGSHQGSRAELAGSGQQQGQAGPAPGRVPRMHTWPVYLQNSAAAAGLPGQGQQQDGSGGGAGAFLPASYAALGFGAAGAAAAASSGQHPAAGAPGYTTHSVHAVSNPLLVEAPVPAAPASDSESHGLLVRAGPVLYNAPSWPGAVGTSDSGASQRRKASPALISSLVCDPVATSVVSSTAT